MPDATITVHQGSLCVIGAMTCDTATALLKAGVAAATDSPVLFDLSGVAAVDSAALAILFGWQRQLLAQGKTMAVHNPPASLISLAAVYGVADLLPLATSPHPTSSSPC